MHADGLEATSARPPADAAHPDPRPRDSIHPHPPPGDAAHPHRPPSDATPPNQPPTHTAPRARLRVLLVEFARPDPAAITLARTLRDEGMEVIHAGPLDTLEQLRATADQEDPDAVGVLGAGPPPGLAEALNGVRVLPTRDPGKAVEWLRGGRSHTSGTPSDRVR